MNKLPAAIVSLLMMTAPCAVSNDQACQTVADNEMITNITFVAFDTETTGLNSLNGRLVEIGAVKFKDRQIIDMKNWLINPEIHIPEDACSIHGITDAAVVNSPKFSDVFCEFAAFVKGTVLLAHNANFDVRFISAELNRCNITPPPNMILDTLHLSRAWFPDLKSHSIENLLVSLNMELDQEHRALSDAECVMKIFIRGAYSGSGRPPTAGNLKKHAGKVLFFNNN